MFPLLMRSSIPLCASGIPQAQDVKVPCSAAAPCHNTHAHRTSSWRVVSMAQVDLSRPPCNTCGHDSFTIETQRVPDTEAIMTIHDLGDQWYERMNRHAADLYPGRYTREVCTVLTKQALAILALLRAKRSTLLVHNYLTPEFHELVRLATEHGVPAYIGDSLGLSMRARDAHAERVD